MTYMEYNEMKNKIEEFEKLKKSELKLVEARNKCRDRDFLVSSILFGNVSNLSTVLTDIDEVILKDLGRKISNAIDESIEIVKKQMEDL